MHLHHCFADWQGIRGPVIVLGNLNIERDFPVRTYNKMLGTTLHGLAHIFERPSLFQPRPYNQQYIRAEAIVPLESEASKLVQQIEDAEQAFAEATAKHEESMSPLYIRRNEINAIRKRANQARTDLRQTCEDRELVSEYDEVIEQLNEAQHEVARLDEEITKRKSWASQDKEKAKATPFRQEANGYSSQVEEHGRILADLQAKFEPAENAVSAMQERLSEIENRLLEP